MNRSDSIRRDRSFDSIVYRLLRLHSQNHESFKAAAYNFLIAAGVSAFIAVCFVFSPFLRPLLWAFLLGAVLFPFKRKLAQLLNNWFERCEENDANMAISVCLAPLEATEYCGKLLVSWLYSHYQMLGVGFGVAISIKVFMFYAPKGLICTCWQLILLSHSLFAQLISLLNIYYLLTLIAMYLTLVYFFWNKENSTVFFVTGQTIWVGIAGYMCSFLGALQMPVFMLVMIFVCVSMIYHLRSKCDSGAFVEEIQKLLNKTDFEKSIGILSSTNTTYVTSSDAEDISMAETIDSVATIFDSSAKSNKASLESPSSDLYLKILLYACLATFLYRNLLVCFLAAIPVSIHILNTAAEYTGFKYFIYFKINVVYLSLRAWAIEHHSAVLPLCLPGVLELSYKINAIIRDSLKSSVDLVTSIFMIILMLFAIIVLGIFFCANIYSETIEVAYLGKDVLNKTITCRPELIDILPADVQSSIDDALDNAHHYGRRKIEAYINDWLADADTEHAEKLKGQILNVWDRLIQYWIDRNKSDSSYGPRVPTEALKSTIGEIVDNPHLVLVAKQGMLGWAKSNTQTILEVSESLWHIVKTNISIIISFTGEILRLVMSGGMACIEFILDMIVFFTALFYLLSNSQTKYAPLQITEHIGFLASGPKIAETLEHSISGVLISMCKCSIFTGLFTWLVHTVFGARIIFLPSALAAILSAAPFLCSYWCALPAFFELWLAQGRFYEGVLLLVLQIFIPPHVEATIYSEMKSGVHPYITGLSIAGGMYWFGLQGAIFGPLMLCGFIGIFEVAVIAMRADSGRHSSQQETPSA